MLFYAESENVLNNYSEIIDGMVMKNYSKNRKRPQVYNDIERAKENDKNKDEITPKDIWKKIKL